ncbi:MAG TPA: hypothetical protein VE684_19000 [Crenalkalicoccus sp.]|nr:hypothetical protein [Crenalkalicoccus sp.]
MRILLRLLPLAAAALLSAAPPAEARAAFFFGFGPSFYFGPPAFYYPPPVYYPPPYVYAPPPPAYAYPSYGYLAPGSAPPPVAGGRCVAGAYTCPAPSGARPGDSCACATGRGNAWGRVSP